MAASYEVFSMKNGVYKPDKQIGSLTITSKTKVSEVLSTLETMSRAAGGHFAGRSGTMGVETSSHKFMLTALHECPDSFREEIWSQTWRKGDGIIAIN